MNINEEIQKLTDKAISEQLPQMIEKSVSKMLESIIDDIFRSYSDTAEAIKTKIEEKLDVNLQRFDLVDYNALVSDIINKNLLERVNLSIEPINELIKETVGFINKKEMTLAGFIQDEIISELSSHEGGSCGCDESEGEISLYIEYHDIYEWYNVYLDVEGDKKKDECAVAFTLSKDGCILSFSCKGRYGGQTKLVSPERMQWLDGIERKLFRIHSSQVKMIHDGKSIETEWSKYY